MTVSACATSFLESQRQNNCTAIHIKTLAKHFRRFEKEFGTRKIHEISTLEIIEWIGSRTDEDSGKPWSVKTRRSVRASLVSLSLYAQSVLKSIPQNGKTEFQNVKSPKKESKAAVEIYTPDDLKALFSEALKAASVELIPGLIVGNLFGLRPYEFHAEGMEDKRPSLKWEAFNWNDMKLHVEGQKIRSKATRDIPISKAAEAWLQPFRDQRGDMWTFKKAYEDKMHALRTSAKVRSIYDGFRHSYASYRIRTAKHDLDLVAAEMGNSPQELLNSYKRNVTDAEAEKWFNLMPPDGYAERVAELLSLRQAV